MFTGVSLGRQAQLAIENAQKTVSEAIFAVQEELSELQGKYALLQAQHESLLLEHKEVQAQLQTQTDGWREFKAWWMDAVERKRALAKSAHPSPSTSAQHISLSSLHTPNSGKDRLSKAEVAILDKVGLSPLPRHTEGEVTPATTSKVKSDRGVDDRPEVEPEPPSLLLGQNAVDEDGEYKAERREEKTSKRKRMTNRRVNDRSALQDIGNQISYECAGASHHAQDLIRFGSTSSPERLRQSNQLRQGVLHSKRRGRYSGAVKKDDITINGEFEIDPQRNGDARFLHKTVVRDKSERKNMHAFDCECCSEYYRAVGEAPLRKYEDPTRRISRQLGEHNDAVTSRDDGEEGRRQEHRQRISRHRDYGPPAATPPGYWDIGFPDTQRQEEVNQLAREEHRMKRERISRDPRFKRRS